MDTVHDSQAFISHHLNMLERPSTPGKINVTAVRGVIESSHDTTFLRCVALFSGEQL